jgi:hypothetical protein
MPANNPTSPIVNTVERDPLVAQAQGNIQQYIEGSNEFANRAMESAGMKTRDAYEGVFKGLDANAARRGIGGSGAANILKRRGGENLAAALAQQNEDIALGEHKNIGGLLGQSGDLALGANAAMQAQQRIGLDNYMAQLQQANQGFQQMLALSNQYPQRQPATYYEESDPETAPVYGGGGGSGGVGVGGGRTGVFGH